MARTKGSKNKVIAARAAVVDLNDVVVKTELFELFISKDDIEEIIRKEAKTRAGFTSNQVFEDYKAVHTKTGGVRITMTNPLNLITNKDFVKGDDHNKIVNKIDTSRFTASIDPIV